MSGESLLSAVAAAGMSESASAASPSSSDVSSPPPSSSPQSRSPSSSIIVSNLSPVLTLSHLEDLFSTIGPIHSLRWHQPQPADERLCVIDFVHAKHADTALLITDTDIGDKKIHIEKLEVWQARQAESTAHASLPAAPSPSASLSLPADAAAAVADPQPPKSGGAPIPPSTATPSPSQPPTSSSSNAATAATSAAHLAQPLSAPSLTHDPTFTSGTIYVGNLSPQVTDAILHAYFSQLGPLVGTKMQADAASPNRFGFVEWENPMVAQAALALHGQMLMGRAMKIGKASTGVGRTGAGVLSAEERTARATALGRGVSDKVTSALAKVAAAQESIANKLGVKVQTPVTVTAAPLLQQLGVPLSSVTAAPSAVSAAASEEKSSRRRGSRSRSRSPSDGAERNKSSSSRSHRRPSPSSSRSPSRSSSASRSGSHSRSPRRRRHHRSHHHRSSRRRSPSLSSPHRKARALEDEKKKSGAAQVGADRWRAEDSEEAEGERKDGGIDAPTLSQQPREEAEPRAQPRQPRALSLPCTRPSPLAGRVPLVATRPARLVGR